MAFYDFEFERKRVRLRGGRDTDGAVDKGIELLEVGGGIALANTTGESETQKIPIATNLLNAIQRIIFGGTAELERDAKLARMSSDLLALKVAIKGRLGLSLAQYPFAEASVDLKRYEHAATGAGYR